MRTRPRSKKPFLKKQQRLGKQFRDLFLKAVSKVEEGTPLMFSGGVDSTSILFACLNLGWKPDLYTVQLGNYQSPDVIAAKTIANDFHIPLHIVKIPQDEKKLIADIEYLIDILNYPKKTHIQVTQPYMYLCEAMQKDGFTKCMHGAMADALYGNIQSILIHRKEHDQEWFRNERRINNPAMSGSEAEQKLVASKYGVAILDPYQDSEFMDFMINRTWEELNEPKVKMLALLAFPEYWGKGAYYRKPLNMQIGAGIRTWHDTLLDNPELNPSRKKGIIAVYNRMINRVKPKFRPLSMAEVRATYENYNTKYTAVSTFSGAGGSCLGLKLAGYNVLWANEFIKYARDTYRANYPETYLDGRDIREVKGDEILSEIGLEVGELDLLEGSPPCASFSTAGNQAKDWGKVKKYSNTRQRTDDLFFEYSRLLGELKPKTFIAENVSGLVKGCGKGYYKMIMEDLQSKGYVVKSKLIDAVNLGVPQTRERLIFMGVRKDIKIEAQYPEPLPYTYNILDAIPDFMVKDFPPKPKDIKRVPENDWCYYIPEGEIMDLWKATNPKSNRNSLGDTFKKLKKKNSYFTHYKVNPMKPVPTILQTLSTYHPKYPRSLTIGELKRLSTFPDDFRVTGSSMQMRWERIGRAVPPMMMYHISKSLRDSVLEGLDVIEYEGREFLKDLGLDGDIIDLGDVDEP